jgi:hypothetical protein
MKNKEKQIATLDFYLEPTGIMFTADGEPIGRMSKQKLFEFFDGSSIRAYFQSVESNEVWGGLDNLSNFVLAQRLLQKGLSSVEVAMFMGMEGERFRQLYSHCLQLYQRDVETVKIEKRKYETEDFCLISTRKPFKPTYDPLGQLAEDPKNIISASEKVLVNLRLVKNMLKQNLKPRAIAEEMKLDAKDFEVFLRNNEPFLAVMQ